MKTLKLFFLISMSMNFLYSQNITTDNISSSKKNSVVLEPILKTSKINYQKAFLFGGRIGFLLTNEFEIGAKLSLLSNNISPYYEKPIPDNPKLELLYYGLDIGYKTYFTNSLSASISLFAGYGSTNFKHPLDEIHSAIQSSNKRDFWIIEPKITYGYNLLEWLELKFGVNYRTVFTVKKIRYTTLSEEYTIPMNLNAFNLELGLCINLFSF